jgi:hypothetical protein
MSSKSATRRRISAHTCAARTTSCSTASAAALCRCAGHQAKRQRHTKRKYADFPFHDFLLHVSSSLLRENDAGQNVFLRWSAKTYEQCLQRIHRVLLFAVGTTPASEPGFWSLCWHSVVAVLDLAPASCRRVMA